ncbi:MAG: MBL fold metallo-hydrolase [Chloroflexi bacterium]|nr:MBL fold metallo-hydrolase [Chloroflexota bacterium]
MHYRGEVLIHKMTLGPFATNCYLVACPRTSHAALIDAPAEPEKILAEARGLELKYILMTHNHRDHIQALPQLIAALKVPVAAHPLDAPGLGVASDLALEDGHRVSLGDVTLEVMYTPGHTPGSLCFRFRKHLFSGDTLFPGGPGKTRTPQDLATILSSIQSHLLPLPDNIFVYPGHGDDTTLGQERPAIAAFLGRPRPPDLCGDVLWASS